MCEMSQHRILVYVSNNLYCLKLYMVLDARNIQFSQYKTSLSCLYLILYLILSCFNVYGMLL